MTLEQLQNIDLSFAEGENSFSMKRGSFNYKEKIRNKRKLIRKNSEIKDNKLVIKYEDPDNKVICSLIAAENNNEIEIKLRNYPETVNRFWLELPAYNDERIYGCGETYSKFNLKNEKVRIFVAEHQNSNRIARKLIREKILGPKPDHVLPFDKYESYYAQPTYISSRKYYVHCDTGTYAVFDFRKDKTVLYFQQAPHIYIGKADTFEELSYKLSSRLGRQKELPDWLYDGCVLAVQGGTDIINQKIDTALNNGIKVNGIWSQDWCGCRKTGFGYQVMWNWEVDNDLYPDLRENIKKWKEKGIRFMGYINPFMALEKDLYKYASEKGYCVKDKEGKDYLVTITTFPAAMIDFTNPQAYNWYKNIIKENIIGLGMSGWMADFGEYLPMDCVLYEGKAEKLHNHWPEIWAKLNKEAIEECGKEDEILFFTRAGYTETVKNSYMMWTGDHHVDFSKDDGIGSVITASLSLAVCGCGLSHSDAGGYTTVMHMKRDEELLMRWEELCAFSPFMRFHEGNQPVNNVQFDSDDALLNNLRKYSNVHVKLKDYLKECVKENAEKGIPVMRPLFYYYDEDKAYEISDEYLLGRDLLVAPVLDKGKTEREVYLPDDTWMDLRNNKLYTGGTYTVEVPLEEIAVFKRVKEK